MVLLSTSFSPTTEQNSRPSILIVEDEFIIAEDLRETLEMGEFDVCGIEGSGKKALESAREMQPDLVLMDINLKDGLTGIDTARTIMDQLDIPVIFLSAFSDGETVGKAKEVYPYGYLVKPFQEKELVTTIEVALQKHRRDSQIRRRATELGKLVGNLGEGLLGTNQEGQITYVNEPAAALLGQSAEELLYQPGAEYLRLSDSLTGVAYPDILALVRQQRSPLQLGKGTLFHRSNGDRRHVLVTASPLLSADPDSAEGVVVLIRDVTESAMQEAHLQVLTQALAAMPSGLLILQAEPASDQFRVTAANPAACALLQRPEAALLHATLNDLLPDEKAEALSQLLLETMRERHPGQVIGDLIPDQEEAWYARTFLLGPGTIGLSLDHLGETADAEEESHNKESQELPDAEGTLSIEDSLFVKKNKRWVRIRVREIDYIQSMQNYVVIHLGKQNYTLHATMKDMVKRLPTPEFIRVHRQYIVQAERVSALEEGFAIVGTEAIPISQGNRTEVMNFFKASS